MTLNEVIKKYKDMIFGEQVLLMKEFCKEDKQSNYSFLYETKNQEIALQFEDGYNQIVHPIQKVKVIGLMHATKAFDIIRNKKKVG